MRDFKELFYKKTCQLREQLTSMVKERGDTPIGTITLKDIFKGLRGLPLAYSPLSEVKPKSGVHYRGSPIKKVHEVLPRLNGSSQPSAEALFLYLLAGEIPTPEEVEAFRVHLHAHAFVPSHSFAIIDSFPRDAQTMTKFCAGILSCAPLATYPKVYGKVAKDELWEYAYSDTINLFAKIPLIASQVYRHHCNKPPCAELDPSLDWTGNLARMMGYDSPDIHDLLRLYVFTHAEHEATNVSAHTSRLVSSSLSNIFYSYAAGVLGLAGPLHGHANEQAISWVFNVIKSAQEEDCSPTELPFLKKYVLRCLDKKQVIPGYGHATLRVEDPRFSIFYRLVEDTKMTSLTIEVVKALYEVVPSLLQAQGKASNTNPNIDAITGAVLHTMGITEHDCYPLLFGISRFIGVGAQYVTDRVLHVPLERPSMLRLDVVDT